jgi:hypothetical protein
LLNAPVGALAGVTDADGESPLQAFQGETIGDLGRNKSFRAARALMTLVESGAK